MSSVPLLSHTSLDAIFAYRPSGALRVRDFLAEAHALAALLPAGKFLLNVCQDRYHFAVGLAAGLIAGKTSLQPSSQTAETLRQIKAGCPDVCCLCDSEFDHLDLLRIEYPSTLTVNPENGLKIPQIPGDFVAVQLFTSGSTGTPVAHSKTWGRLALSGRTEAQRLALGPHPHSIVATVPAQHSYGFESSILLAMHGQLPFWSGKPFYPLDIVAALQAVPPPRLLVTTPFHLSALLAAELDLPAIDLILSATAPLSRELATAAEARCQSPLLEIYGSTESGQLASRRTSADLAWELLPALHLLQENGETIAFGGHVEGRVALSDCIELRADGCFLLHGRHADLINIAGRRTSLAYLNHQITAIPGVHDAAFFLPDSETADGITRLCAFVVAPGLNRRQLLAELRQRIDSIFLPRPLFFVDQLPRNSTGKLPRSHLQVLYASQLAHVEH